VIEIARGGDPLKVASLDFELGNPRISHGRFREDVDIGLQIAVKYRSHGEVVRSIIRDMPKDTLLLVDEPDAGLSPRSAYWLSKQLRDHTATGQVVAAVHNPILIQEAGEVLSLEHKRWMSGEEFLELHRTTPHQMA